MNIVLNTAPTHTDNNSEITKTNQQKIDKLEMFKFYDEVFESIGFDFFDYAMKIKAGEKCDDKYVTEKTDLLKLSIFDEDNDENGGIKNKTSLQMLYRNHIYKIKEEALAVAVVSEQTPEREAKKQRSTNSKILALLRRIIVLPVKFKSGRDRKQGFYKRTLALECNEEMMKLIL